MPTRICTICGEEPVFIAERWFLVAESRWEDKLRILEWDERLATQSGIHQACSVAHVQELVVHWMTTGSVDYPFALARSKATRLRFWKRAPQPKPIEPSNLDAETPIGELAVDRASLHRVLSESPHSLKSILDALMAALQRETRIPRRRHDIATPPLEIAARQV